MSVNIRKTPMVQFAELVDFMAVAEQRSFTGAAAHLGVSAAALGQTIRVAEQRLGVRLLNRTTRRVAPTPAGERLLERLRVIVHGLGTALEALDH